MTRRTSARRLAGLCLLAAAAAMPVAASAQTTPQTGTFIGNYRPVATDDPIVQEAAAFLAEQAGGAIDLYPRGDTRALADRVQSLLDDPAKLARRKAQTLQLALQRFNAEEELRNVFEEERYTDRGDEHGQLWP
jgi:hypothetical protein